MRNLGKGKTVYGLAYAMLTGGAVSAFTLGLAAPALGAPSGPGSGQDTVTDVNQTRHEVALTMEGLPLLNQCSLPSIQKPDVVDQAVLLTAWC